MKRKKKEHKACCWAFSRPWPNLYVQSYHAKLPRKFQLPNVPPRQVIRRGPSLCEKAFFIFLNYCSHLLVIILLLLKKIGISMYLPEDFICCYTKKKSNCTYQILKIEITVSSLKRFKLPPSRVGGGFQGDLIIFTDICNKVFLL